MVISPTARPRSPRNFMPTERLRFQSNYFKNFETSGSLGYSTANNSVPNFNEIVNDYVTRSGSRGSTTGGPADAKRVSVNANWSGVYSVTDKFRILDSFRYDNWRTPGLWDTSETNIFGQMQPGLVGLAQPQALFTAATFLSLCPAPYTAATCPESYREFVRRHGQRPHVQFSGAEHPIEYLRVPVRLHAASDRPTSVMSTPLARLPISTRLSIRRKPISQAGPAAPPRTIISRRAETVPCLLGLHAETVDPTTGQLISLTFSGPAAGNDTSRNITGISENTLLVGFTARPMDTLQITGDFQFGYNDYSFTRISPRQVQSYKVHANYKPRAWINFDGAIDIHENRDNVSTVNDIEHGRSYSFVTTLMPKSKLFFDLGYTYTDIYNAGADLLLPQRFWSSARHSVPSQLGLCASRRFRLGVLLQQAALRVWRHHMEARQRVTATVGYAGTFVGGNTLAIDPLQVPGTLAFNYQKPYVRAIFDLYKGLSYRMTWNYYGYNGKGQASNAIPGTGGNSHTGFQRQHGGIRTPLRFLKRGGEIELKMWRSGQ